MTATVADPAGNVAPLFDGIQGAGAQTLTWTPPAGQPAGAYRVELSASAADGATATADVSVLVDPAIASFTDSAAAFSPTRGDPLTLAFTLAAGPVQAEVDVVQGASIAEHARRRHLPAGRPHRQLGRQKRRRDGRSRTAPTPSGSRSPTRSVRSSATCRSRSTRLRRCVTAVSARTLRFTLSEPATVTLEVGARRYTSPRKAGPFHFWLKTKPYAYKIVAVDAAGNTFRALYRTR